MDFDPDLFAELVENVKILMEYTKIKYGLDFRVFLKGKGKEGWERECPFCSRCCRCQGRGGRSGCHDDGGGNEMYCDGEIEETEDSILGGADGGDPFRRNVFVKEEVEEFDEEGLEEDGEVFFSGADEEAEAGFGAPPRKVRKTKGKGGKRKAPTHLGQGDEQQQQNDSSSAETIIGMKREDVQELINRSDPGLTFVLKGKISEKSSVVWSSFKFVYLNGSPLEYVRCDKCEIVYKYTKEAGTKTLLEHKKKCDGSGGGSRRSTGQKAEGALGGGQGSQLGDLETISQAAISDLQGSSTSVICGRGNSSSSAGGPRFKLVQ